MLGRGDAASASRSWLHSSCFLSAAETRSAWSIAQLLKVAMVTFGMAEAYVRTSSLARAAFTAADSVAMS